MNINRMKALFKRELVDIFRDKKTLVMMILLPLILYPSLIVVMTLITSTIAHSEEEKVYQVAFENVSDKEAIEAILVNENSDIGYKLEVVPIEDTKTALEQKDIYAYVKQVQEDGKTTYQICYLSAVKDSVTAANAVFDGIELYREQLRKNAVLDSGLNEEQILYPIAYHKEDLSSNEESMGNIIGSFIPMLIITSICIGAIYPAIDVTAGEKERGTLETLLTLPVTNFEMIMSKFLAVSVIACVSAVLNIISLGGAFAFMISFLTEGAGFEFDFASFIPGILFTMLLMMVFALFVTACCMCVCVFAKSFKEANNYITPLLLVFMFAGYAGAVPNFELSATTAAIPVINVTLLIKDLFTFKYNYALFGIVLISNIIYSLLTIMVLGKIYNSEAVLFSEGFGSLKLFTKRSEMKKNQIPGYGDIILLSCVVILAMFYIGTLAQVKFGFGGVAINQMLILFIPLLYAWYIKVDLKKLLSIRMPKLKSFIASICMFIGVYCINLILSIVLSMIFKESTSNVNEAFSIIMEEPVWALVIVIALMPAIGEELMFRGFILGSLRTKHKCMMAILITSAIFGLYHMSLVKFLPTAFLGAMMAVLLIGSDSIIPAMLMHFLNNLMSIIITKYGDTLEAAMPNSVSRLLFEENAMSVGHIVVFFLIGAIFMAAAVMLLDKENFKKRCNK